MNILKHIKRSKEKSVLMGRLIDTLDYTRGKKTEENKEEAFENFYKFIINDEILGSILKKYNADYKTVKFWIEYLNAQGYGWYKNNYIPVSAFSFVKPLTFIMEEINKKTSVEIIGYEIKKYF